MHGGIWQRTHGLSVAAESAGLCGSSEHFGKNLGASQHARITASHNVRAIERRYLVFARSIGATKFQTYARIIFPLALPAMISGLRVGTGLVVIGVVVTEMLASLGGIGYLISYHRTLFNTGHVYFGMMLALVMSVAVNIGLTWLDRRIGVWRMREQAEG